MPGWNTDTHDFAQAISEFEAALPGFWWSVGQCSVGAHASCSVDGSGCQRHLLKGVKAKERASTATRKAARPPRRCAT
jgi:hypothetical protein